MTYYAIFFINILPYVNLNWLNACYTLHKQTPKKRLSRILKKDQRQDKKL